ncbi:N-acetylneuraminate synthase [Azospirillum palustre]
MAHLTVAGRRIGAGSPCFVIAEAGINHNGSMEMAHRLIDTAADAGADAVKFQTFHAELVMTPDAPKAAYQTANTGSDGSQMEMVRVCQLSAEQFVELQAHCTARGVLFLSTPFDHRSIEILDRMDVPAFKVPSGEVVNRPMLRDIGRRGRPVILSTGMAMLGEVEAALGELETAGAPGIAILHCTSNYPAAVGDVNLRALGTLAAAFGRPVGYSDHTLGHVVSVAAVALGACIIEKHITMDRSLPGPDHPASLDPAGLRAMIDGIRSVEAALGDGRKRPAAAEIDTLRVARRSLFLARDVAAGALIDDTALVALRPSGGISPYCIDEVIGRRARRDLRAGDRIGWGDIG